MPYKLTKCIFLPAVLIAIGLRIFLKWVAIDPSSGFYETTNRFPVVVFSGILLLGGVGILLAGWLEERKSTVYARYDGAVWPLCLLAGLATLPLAFFSALEQFEYLAQADFGTSLFGVALLVLLRLLLLAAVPFASAVLLIVLAFRLRTDSRDTQVNGLWLLLPLLWQLANLLLSYMSYTSSRYASDQRLEIVLLIFLVLALLGWGRVLGGINPTRGMRQLTIFGLGYALVALPVSIGVLVAEFGGFPFEMGMDRWSALFHLCFGLYLATLCLRTRRQ